MKNEIHELKNDVKDAVAYIRVLEKRINDMDNG
ncbi:unnamed protein product, partial [Cuscuta epithymum]